MIEQQHDGGRAGAIDIEHVAGEQHGVGVFGQRRFEHLFGSLIRGFDQQIAEMVGHFGQTVQRPLEVQIAGVYQSQRLGHRAPPCANVAATIAYGIAIDISRASLTR